MDEMNRKIFFYLIFLFSVFFVFLKIYQHNLLIKLNYEKQHLDRIAEDLKKEKNLKLAQLYQLKDFKKVKDIAQKDLFLIDLSLLQIKNIQDLNNTVSKN